MIAGQRYHVVVADHDYRCCGGGWHGRLNGEYIGTMLSVQDDEFLLQIDNPLRGKAAEVIAPLRALEELRSVD